MLDEPSQGLAPKVVTQLYEQLRAVHEAGTAILLVEQNTIVALTYAARAYVLEHGRITLSGSSADLRGSDEIRAAYLGI
jgi:branched-chain amino acid transport system ATP-binding protein